MVIPFKLGVYNNTKILDLLGPQNWVRTNIIIKTNRGTLITDVKSLTLVRVQFKLPLEGPLVHT